MGFEALLGNERLKQNLSRSIQRGHISHFYLISGPAGSGKHTLAKLLAAAILCTGSDRPCGTCSACRKALGDAHPDLITVTDPEHKTVAVKIIRQVRDDMFIRPNEAEKKIYLLPQELATEGQNALLKVLEEPPSYGVFILLTDNPQKLLPTIRSRCTELALTALDRQTMLPVLHQRYPEASEEALASAVSRSGGYLGQALTILEEGADLPAHTQNFLLAYSARDAYTLTTTLVKMEKWKRDDLLDSLHQWTSLLENALAYRSGMPVSTPMARELTAARSGSELMQAITCLQKAIEYTQHNVSTGAVCGYLVWALR